MGQSVYPIPSSASSISANTIVAAASNTMYSNNVTLVPGIYTITCPSYVDATVFFHSATDTIIMKTTTVSGTSVINLATEAKRVVVFTNTGTDIAVNIEKTANALTNNFSGTLDTVTASGTYTGTSASGFGYAVLFGAGGGSSGGNGGYHFLGGNGGVAEKIVTLTGSMPVVIGQGSAYGSALPGGSSTFAGMTAGGAGGRQDDWTTPIPGGVATGGTYNTQGYGGGPVYNGDMQGRLSASTPVVFKPAAVNPITRSTGYGMQPLYGMPGCRYNGDSPATQGVLFVLRF